MIFRCFKVFRSYRESKIQSLILRIEKRQITNEYYTWIVDRYITVFQMGLLIIYINYNSIDWFPHCRWFGGRGLTVRYGSSFFFCSKGVWEFWCSSLIREVKNLSILSKKSAMNTIKEKLTGSLYGLKWMLRNESRTSKVVIRAGLFWSHFLSFRV